MATAWAAVIAGITRTCTPGHCLASSSTAVASRVGAPLGHDYAVISLSDRLKPWEVIAPRPPAAPRSPPTA
ncbi:hypothetical protein MAHJHV29_48690 [Mycobacterium avium subsp. hominissuis]